MTLRTTIARWRSYAPRLAVTGAALLLLGCDTVPVEEFRTVQRESQAAKERGTQLEQQVAAEQKTVRNLQEQLANARGMDGATFDQLIVPVRIKLASRSGGYDLDGKPGDDGVVLYVQPIDRDGHVIKAAGSISVTLLDLSEPSKPGVISEYEFDLPTTRTLWYGRLMTNHFTVRCPWPPSGPPPIDEVTARIEFTDLLTGRVLIAQQRFEIQHAAKLASRPAK